MPRLQLPSPGPRAPIIHPSPLYPLPTIRPTHRRPHAPQHNVYDQEHELTPLARRLKVKVGRRPYREPLPRASQLAAAPALLAKLPQARASTLVAPGRRRTQSVPLFSLYKAGQLVESFATRDKVRCVCGSRGVPCALWGGRAAPARVWRHHSPPQARWRLGGAST